MKQRPNGKYPMPIRKWVTHAVINCGWRCEGMSRGWNEEWNGGKETINTALRLLLDMASKSEASEEQARVTILSYRDNFWKWACEGGHPKYRDGQDLPPTVLKQADDLAKIYKKRAA